MKDENNLLARRLDSPPDIFTVVWLEAQTSDSGKISRIRARLALRLRRTAAPHLVRLLLELQQPSSDAPRPRLPRRPALDALASSSPHGRASPPTRNTSSRNSPWLPLPPLARARTLAPAGRRRRKRRCESALEGRRERRVRERVRALEGRTGRERERSLRL
jgi:hypothetical protein